MSIDIEAPSGWKVVVNQLESEGICTLQHKKENAKIHCNKQKDSYQIVLVHPIEGPIAKTDADDIELVNESISKVSERL